MDSELKIMRVWYTYTYQLTKDEKNKIGLYVGKINPKRDSDLQFNRGGITFMFRDCSLLFEYTKYIAKIMNKNIHFIEDSEIEQYPTGYSLFVWS